VKTILILSSLLIGNIANATPKVTSPFSSDQARVLGPRIKSSNSEDVSISSDSERKLEIVQRILSSRGDFVDCSFGSDHSGDRPSWTCSLVCIDAPSQGECGKSKNAVFDFLMRLNR